MAKVWRKQWGCTFFTPARSLKCFINFSRWQRERGLKSSLRPTTNIGSSSRRSLRRGTKNFQIAWAVRFPIYTSLSFASRPGPFPWPWSNLCSYSNPQISYQPIQMHAYQCRAMSNNCTIPHSGRSLRCYYGKSFPCSPMITSLKKLFNIITGKVPIKNSETAGGWMVRMMFVFAKLSSTAQCQSADRLVQVFNTVFAESLNFPRGVTPSCSVR